MAPTAIPSPLNLTASPNHGESEFVNVCTSNTMPMGLTKAPVVKPTYLDLLVRTFTSAAASQEVVPLTARSAAGAPIHRRGAPPSHSNTNTKNQVKRRSAHMMPPINPVRNLDRATTALATEIPAISPHAPIIRMSAVDRNLIVNSTVNTVPVQRIVKNALASAIRNLAPRECRTGRGSRLA